MDSAFTRKMQTILDSNADLKHELEFRLGVDSLVSLVNKKEWRCVKGLLSGAIFIDALTRTLKRVPLTCYNVMHRLKGHCNMSPIVCNLVAQNELAAVVASQVLDVKGKLSLSAYHLPLWDMLLRASVLYSAPKSCVTFTFNSMPVKVEGVFAANGLLRSGTVCIGRDYRYSGTFANGFMEGEECFFTIGCEVDRSNVFDEHPTLRILDYGCFSDFGTMQYGFQIRQRRSPAPVVFTHFVCMTKAGSKIIYTHNVNDENAVIKSGHKTHTVMCMVFKQFVLLCLHLAKHADDEVPFIQDLQDDLLEDRFQAIVTKFT